MKKITKISRNENAPANKADVREIITEMVAPIVTKVILEIVPPLVNEIVSREIEKLAIMIKHGFDDIEERMATKYDLNQLDRKSVV